MRFAAEGAGRSRALEKAVAMRIRWTVVATLVSSDFQKHWNAKIARVWGAKRARELMIAWGPDGTLLIPSERFAQGFTIADPGPSRVQYRKVTVDA